ncbi:MAG: hypothetical protein KatS3mg097_512 [Candidatus Parcubacteria bacterium]|nr:MAG: hypothetical protein KatS3mg097_512 [Candidatus Parcubacteria bacterium]
MKNYRQNYQEKQNSALNSKNLDEILAKLKTNKITNKKYINETEYHNKIKIYFCFTAQLATILEQNKTLTKTIKNNPELASTVKKQF